MSDNAKRLLMFVMVKESLMVVINGFIKMTLLTIIFNIPYSPGLQISFHEFSQSL
jgi:hypothetical protein